MEENKWKSKNFFYSFKYALNGIKYALITGRNIKIQSIFAILAIIAGIVLKISLIEWAFLTFTIFLVIFAEMMNSSIETAVDLITLEENEKAKIAKDVAAGAVLLTALNSIIVGLIIFLPKILNMIF